MAVELVIQNECRYVIEASLYLYLTIVDEIERTRKMESKECAV